MSKLQPVSVPPVKDVEDLRIHMVKQLNDVARTIAKSSTRTEDLNLSNHRIQNVANPSDGGDAVNLTTLNQKLDELRAQIQGSTVTPRAPITIGDGTILLGAFGSKPKTYPTGTIYIATDRGYESYVYNSGWKQLSQDTDANFIPSSDLGASLGGGSTRFSTLSLGTGGANIGGASAPAYPLEVRVAGAGAGAGQVHIAPGDVDDGTWIMSLSAGGHPGVWISQGAYFNGTNWIAKNSQATIIILDQTGSFNIDFNSGLTVGNSFSPSPIFTMDSSGNITKVGTITAPTVNATSAFQANGTPGTTGTATLTAGHTITFSKGLCTAFT